MDPLSIAASVVALLQVSEVILSSCYRFVGKVRDAEADVDRVIRQVGHLSAILEDLGSVCEEDRRHSTGLDGLGGENGSLARIRKSLDELKARLAGAAGPMSFRRKLQWPLDSKKVREIMDKISAEMPLLELAIVGDSHAVTVDIRNAIGEVKRREEREAILNWLRCKDPSVKQVASRKLHQPGSNTWLLNADAFKTWESAPGQYLWLHGIPGAGKTILSSTIIDHLEEVRKSQPVLRLAYYYFDFSDQSAQNLGYMFRCLLWQLCSQDEMIAAAVLSLYAACDSGRKEASDEVLASTLFEVLNCDRQTFVILDALDECPPAERERFFNLLLAHTGQESSCVNFLFTSRKERDIEECMGDLGDLVKLHVILISTGDVTADIRLYVSHQLSTRRATRDWADKNLRKEVEDTIAEGAHGMFRWAYCQLDLIKNCKQARKVRQTLKSLPKTLDATYDRILASIPDEIADIALSALMLLAYSARPITLHEVAEAMVVDYQRRTFDPDEDRLTNCREVLEICGSLVTVLIQENRQTSKTIPWLAEKNDIERGGWIREGTPLEIIQFAHFTVKEYMLLMRSRSNPKIERFSFSAGDSHRAIAELSLTYLLEFSKGQRLDKIDHASFPFLAYAARYWTEHWSAQLGDKKDDDDDQETVNGLIRRLFDTESEPNIYINYLNICRPDAMVDQEGTYSFLFRNRQAKSLDAFPQPLYYAAQLGHAGLCAWLITQKGCDVHSRRGRFGQAIHVAARFGHAAVVALLLDHGAAVDALAGEYGYPLQAAALGGHTETLRVLLARGAHLNAVGGKHGTALIAACKGGHVEAARLLLESGADLDGVCEDQGKALTIGAATGNLAMVRLLLNKGAALDEGSRSAGGSALRAAAGNGHVDMVRLLVAAGADVNVWSEGEGTALMAACRDRRGEGDGEEDIQGSRYLEVARHLLQSGADPNAHDEACGDALQAAVAATAKGNVLDNDIELVKLLLEAGANLNHRGGIYDSAMRAAVFCGNIAAAHALLDRGVEVDDEVFLLAVENKRETVIPRLLAKGVDVNIENEDGSALGYAIKNEDQMTIEVLLGDPTIDINALTGNDGATALYQAVGRGNLALVERLIERGADARTPCGDGDTCLIRAVRRQDRAMIELLLEHGADINAGRPDYETPLAAACERRDEALVCLLLDRGADVKARAPGDSLDPLQEAAYQGDEQIVKLLLARGADVKAPEGGHGSCLECAILAGSPTLTKLLLDSGAHVNFSRPIEDLDRGRLGLGGALPAAICNPQEGLVPLLVERGADVNFRGRGTPLEGAIERGQDETVDILLKNGADVNAVGGLHGCALMYAILAHSGHPNGGIVQRLLDAGADVNIQCGTYGSPLGGAVQKSNLRLVEKLLDNGANVNAPAGDYGSPLILAIREGDIDVFRLLLARGANIDALYTTRNGRTRSALEVAAEKGADTMFKQLLEHGADVTLDGSAAVVACARTGNTDSLVALFDRGANIHVQQGVPGKALHQAARECQLGAVRLLLQRGVDVNSFGGEYGNALMAALGNYQAYRANLVTSMVELLLDAGASANSPPSEQYTSPLHAAIANRNFNFVQRLISSGANVNAHDVRFGTPLTAASFWGEVELMKQLVDLGADPSLSGHKYGSALQAAAHGGRLAAATYLLSLPTVDVNQRSGKRGFALHAACRLDDRGTGMARLLLARGADVNARGGKYETALQAAAAKGRLEAVKLLLRHGADAAVEGGKFGSPMKAALAKEKKHYHVANYLRRHMAKAQAQGAAEAGGAP